MDTILKLLDELEGILDQSKAVPFSSKVSVDKDEIYDIITEIRLKMPNEIKQAKWVIEERNKILIDAQKEADGIIKSAEERLSKLVDENEVTKRAYEQASEIIEASKKTAKEMRIGANEYADNVLQVAEENLKEMYGRIKEEGANLDAFFNETIEVIFENRQELRGTKK
ncbi:MAG: ATPase [Lachnospiraceae bacterium]|nr:ATPase [Lachnospiraceae bacterium]